MPSRLAANTVVAASAFCGDAARAAFEAVVPIFASRVLGMSSGEYSLLCSVQLLGTLIGVLASGSVSQRLGPRRTVMLTLPLAGALFLTFAALPRWAAYAVLPLAMGLVEVGRVNVNAAVQDLGRLFGHRAAFNVVYRVAGVAAQIATPVLGTVFLPARTESSR